MEADSDALAQSPPHVEGRASDQALAQLDAVLRDSPKFQGRESLASQPNTLRAIVEACRDHGVPPRVGWLQAGASLMQWSVWRYAVEHRSQKDGRPISEAMLRVIDAFMEACACAQAEHDAKMASVISKAAESYNEKTGIPEWRAAAWNLEHGASRSDWFTHRETAVIDNRGFNREVPAEHKVVRAMTDDELIEMNPQYRELLAAPDHSTDSE